MRSYRNSRRRTILSLLVALALLVAALPLPQPVSAATYRNWIAQVPSTPTSVDTVRVWMDSDTAFGETAGLQYNVGSNYVLVLGTYDNTSYPGANWYADIPAQPTGTFVQYHLFTRNQSGSDYGWTGFNWNYTVAAAAGPLTPIGAKAMWLDTNTIAWNGVVGTSYKLLYDPDGAMTTAAEATLCSFPSPAAACYVILTASGTVGGFPKNPNATGKTRLLTGLSVDNAKHLLKGQVVVASYNGGGARVDATRVQIQSVLDYLYVDNGTAENATLGVTYSGTTPSVKLWAPTAKSVTLRRYATSADPEVANHAMTLDLASGVWSVTGDSAWNRQFFLFDVEVYVPSTDMVEHNLVSDPYSVSLSQDGSAAGDVRSQFVNLADSDLKPTGWDTLAKPALAAPEDIVVYEMHVRDFSIGDTTVGAADRGKYKAFTYDGTGPHPNPTLSNGMDHLLKLKDAGLTHVHLLPAFDIASVIEPVAQRSEPSFAFNPGTDRASQTPQAAVWANRLNDGFNWGYDPYHYGVPEGSYASNPDGVQRIVEFRDMVSALNQNGLRVVMDVVYNHTAAAGQDDKSVLDKVVPGYYYRYNTVGAMYNSSCCADTAAEYAMMEKLMIDTVIRFAVDYKVDSFRFDLMNLHTRRNMENLKAAVQGLTVGANGVDGSKIYIYGEGWDFGSAEAKGLTTCPDCYAKQYNMTGTGIGTFNDRMRDASHGGYTEDSLEIRKQGFINGLSYDWNGYWYANRYQSNLWAFTADLRTALAGSGGFYTDDPQETVNYVEKHDNETLFDLNVFRLPSTTSMADRVRSQNMGVSIVGLAQGIPFIQMGHDLLRSKSLDRDSYDSGDWFNRVDWSYNDSSYSNNFGVGLPVSEKNSSRWTIMTPLLNNTALDPAPANAQFGAAHLRETLRIRKSSALFRLTSEAEANARISFFNTDNSKDALIVMALHDDAGAAGLDPNYGTILVFFNANKISQSYTVPGAAGMGFTLHPIQADMIDEDTVVKTSIFDNGTGAFTVPARTTAVFVSTETLVAPLAPSSIDWVGKMYPRGGISHAVNQGAFVPAGFDVYVRVYDAGVTSIAGAPAGIGCYLHWGKYGSVWTDLPMTWNAQYGNDDEFKATILQATLNALAPGTYGFTAYCQRAGEEKKWKVDEYSISVAGDDDQGDGLITVIPTADSSPEPAGGVFVHLFEWPWADIEKECTYLAQKGYTGVQVSPPNEHLVPTADMGGLANDYPWWVRYQPVTHDINKFTSRSGTWAQFQSMVAACNALGVGVYVDAVINHMADIEVPVGAGVGTAGTQYQSTMPGRFYGTQYQADDFHIDCTISNYGDRRQVQQCKLSGLPDLNTGKADVQTELHNYLQALLTAGVKGFRVDGAKHMAAQDIAAVFAGLTSPTETFYVFQEMIDAASERVRDWEYTPNGDVTEFAFPYAIGAAFDDACGGSLSDLQTRFSQPDMLPSRFAQVFTDNHDNQRGHGVATGQCIVDHRDGQEHVLANIFTLAYPYGHPSVMSSYYWQSDPTNNVPGSSGDSKGPPSADSPYTAGSGGTTRPVYGATQVAGNVPANCSATFEDGKWACEHRRTSTANMVKFRQVTAGQTVNNWQNVGVTSPDPSDHIAFGLGSKGFVAINRTANSAVTTYATSMPAGSYCDIVHYDFNPTTGECLVPGTATRAPAADLIVVAANGQIANKTLNARDAFAIHSGAKPLAVTMAGFDAVQQGDAVLLTWETASELGNLGFNLYRSSAPAGPDVQLNGALIPSQSPGSASGFVYSWLDTAELVDGATYFYWLEDLDVSGAATLHGPVSLDYSGPTAVTLSGVQADNTGASSLSVLLVLLALLTAMLLAGVHAARRTLAV